MITARIATRDENYLVAIPVNYGTPMFFFVKKDMETIIREATKDEWIWATTEWNTHVEDNENKGWEFSQSKVDDFLREEFKKFSKKRKNRQKILH